MQQPVFVSTPDELRCLIHEAVSSALATAHDGHAQEPAPIAPMTFAEVRLALRCSAPTLRKLIREGRLRGTRIGDHWRFRPEDVHAFLANGGNHA